MSRDNSENPLRELDYAMSLRPTRVVNERGLSEQDLSPYHPLYNARHQPRADSGYSSRDYSMDRAREDPSYGSEPNESYRAPRAPTSSRSSFTEKTPSRRSTGYRTPSSGVSQYTPSRDTVIHNNRSVIHNRSNYQDGMRSSREDDPRYWKGSSYDSRDERRRAPQPRRRRSSRSRREYDDLLREEDEDEEDMGS